MQSDAKNLPELMIAATLGDCPENRLIVVGDRCL
jgi:hypothetical protein